MASHVLRRLLQAIPLLVAIVSVLFIVLRLSGDPVGMLVPPNARPEDVARIRTAYGFDAPLMVQYVRFLKHMATLDFGESVVYQTPAMPLVVSRLWGTVLLVGGALGLAVVAGIPVGVWTAVHRRSLASLAATLAVLLGQSTPVFVLGLVLITLFAARWHLLPTIGFQGPISLVLPVVTLAAFGVAKTARLTRSGVLDVLGSDYVRTAHAKGVPRLRVIFGHALRNALLPVVASLGVDLARLLNGTVLVEYIFAWPGLGWELVNSVLARDYPVVQAAVFVIACVTLLLSVALDVAYAALNPQVWRR